MRRLAFAADEDVARTAIQTTQPTFEQHWVEGDVDELSSGVHDLHEESTLTRMMYFYFDPAALSNACAGEMIPRLLFEDSRLWATALKLKRAVESHEPETQLYC